MRPDALGEWLPLALADLLIAMMSVFDATELKPTQILAGWGLEHPETKENEEAQRLNEIDRAFNALENA